MQNADRMQNVNRINHSFRCEMLVRYGLLAVLIFSLSCTAAVAGNPRETPLVLALRKAKLAVVNIHSKKNAPGNNIIFNRGKPRKINGMGTGIIIDGRGYIATNHHVVDGVESLRVTFYDGSTYSARVISTDRRHDLAVIKITSSKKLPVMKMGTSSDLMLGESVFAVGNAFGYEHTVTSGIVSALSRDVKVNAKQSYDGVIQTDASINPGNSGGPLINMSGEVIGINVAIRSDAQRIGFAIPIDSARRVISRLISIENIDRHYHGLLTKDIKTKQQRALLVSSAASNSPAAQAGFKAGDVVLQAGQITVVDAVDFERALLGKAVGTKVGVKVRRKGKVQSLTLVVGKYNPTTVVRANNQHQKVKRPIVPVDDTWQRFGVRLVTVPGTTSSLTGTGYHGGMQVQAVRAGSPAANARIVVGDILVGLHKWETIKMSDVSYALKHAAADATGSVKFHILRNRSAMYGYVKFGKSAPAISLNR